MHRIIYHSIERAKRFIEFVAYGVIDYVILINSPKKTIKSNRIIIVNIELLGDYYIWMPYGKIIISHYFSMGKEVVLVCNKDWEELAIKDMPTCKTIGVSRRRLLRSITYRIKLLRHLRGTGSELVLHVSYPREAILGDAIVRALASNAIGFNAGYSDRSFVDMKICNSYYRHLIKYANKSHQIKYANEFIKYLNIKINDSCLSLNRKKIGGQGNYVDNNNYFLISPGGSDKKRHWPKEKMIEIAKRYLDYDGEVFCVIAGLESENELCRYISNALPKDRTINLCGQTNLASYIRLVANAAWILCNDSSAGHIAAAYGIQSFVVLGGGHFGRCYPYPDKAYIYKKPIAIWHEMPCFGCDWICKYNISGDHVYPCVGKVEVESVWRAIIENKNPDDSSIRNTSLYKQ